MSRIVPGPGPPDDEALAAALLELYPFALSLTRDPDLSADLIQDAWLRASRSIGQWRGDAPLSSWLRRIIHNLAVDSARRSGREVPAEQVERRWRDDDYSVDAAVVAERAQTRLRRGRMILVTALAEGQERRENLKGVPMRCWDARQQVSEYLNGDLDAASTMLLERHLEVCPTCPPLYASLVGVRAELGGLRDPDAVIPPDLADRLHARVTPP